ncbi:DUF6907 domain-containing protein [Streptomyces sp. NPDC005279]|uniref:DUF6907 domain-containing protein n=1 Tax=Streptomyces sp. NPDC005279 TaxID=3364712 RepID=UPI0036B1852A
MSRTVATHLSPSGGFIAPSIEGLLSGIPAQPVASRSYTYPLIGGGSLTAACPAWCTTDHYPDLEGIRPADLCHEGAETAIEFPLYDGDTRLLLHACLVQIPFSEVPEAQQTHIVFRPVIDGEVHEDQYMTSAGVTTVVEQLTDHVVRLARLRDQLANEGRC